MIMVEEVGFGTALWLCAGESERLLSSACYRLEWARLGWSCWGSSAALVELRAAERDERQYRLWYEVMSALASGDASYLSDDYYDFWGQVEGVWPW